MGQPVDPDGQVLISRLEGLFGVDPHWVGHRPVQARRRIGLRQLLMSVVADSHHEVVGAQNVLS
ncbi:MAG: hypothetical protein ACR2I7_05170, partial [Geodermatophilaceae bacterium]